VERTGFRYTDWVEESTGTYRYLIISGTIEMKRYEDNRSSK
jgi:hypothetical protein